MAFIGRAGHIIGNKTIIIDATDRYVVPGFLDGHVHVEISMLALTQFARAVSPELRITDKGLVDTAKFQFVNLVIE